jgi:TolB-like protein/Tfp pilus assembly protein PilF
VQKSLAIDDGYVDAHAQLSHVYTIRKEYDKSVNEGEMAVSLAPGSAWTLFWYATALSNAGRPEEALPLFEKAIRLNPLGPMIFHHNFANALRQVGRLEEAVASYKKAIERSPNYFWAHAMLAVVYSQMGKDKEAQAAAAEVMRINPKFSLEWVAKVSTIRDSSKLKELLNTMRKAGLPDKPPLPLPDKPSIAVLPFVNLSEDSKQQLLCDGITENIINALAKVPQLFVIARNSTFTYKGKTVAANQVSEELGVRYVLEGSVQRSGERVRITVQMVDALTGNHLFAERYDGEAADLFALQDDITMKVIGAVRVKLEGLGTSMWMKYYRGSQGLDCFLKFQDAIGRIQRMTVADTNYARQIAEAGLVTCQEGPAFYRLSAIVHLNDHMLGSSKDPQESISKAEEFLLKALAIDDKDAGTLGNLSQVHTRKKEYDKAIAAAERAVTLDPGSSWALYRYAIALNFAGRPEQAIPLFEKAIRLNPLGPSAFYFDFGIALRDTGKMDEAVATLKKSVERAPNWIWPHAHLAVTYSIMGMDQEARAEAAEVLRINPRFSIEWVAKTTAYDQARMIKVYNALRKAGLPDQSPPAHP